MEFYHMPVLLNETLEQLNIKQNGIYVDCTLGGGGHSIEIARQLGENGRLIGIDRDIAAINAATKRLEGYGSFTPVHDNYSNIISILQGLGIHKVDGILMDLGVSSHQLDEKDRGFTYMEDAPLDMRMDTNQPFSAYDVVNQYSMDELFRIIKEYGEERWAKRISKFIVENRPVKTTGELVEIIKRAIPAAARRTGPHPAKRTFQAIRIEVNKELELLEQSVLDAVECLKPNGRLCIITFHSLEDRIVKNTYRKLNQPCTCPKEFPVCTCGKEPVVDLITRKPITASESELEINPRSRSAKLRTCEKI